MDHPLIRFRPRQRGVTLIELMIGLAIGMLAVLLMAGVGMAYEASKRTATAGYDAQVASALALHALQSDLQMAGYGLATGGLAALGCPIKARRGGTDYTWSLTPVRITRPERYLAVIAKGDEVLDWREMTARYPGCPQRLIEGSDHGLSDFDDHLPAILHFLNLHP